MEKQKRMMMRFIEIGDVSLSNPISIVVDFGSKRALQKVVKLFGEPPCSACIVGPCCKEEYIIDKENSYFWTLDNCCPDMGDWIEKSSKTRRDLHTNPRCATN